MHLFFIARGINHQMDMFKKFMETQMFPWKRKNLNTNKDEIVQVQGALRPIQLYEYVFPEESLQEVLTMLNIDESGKDRQFNKSNARAKVLRLALGNKVKKVPKYKKLESNRYIEKTGIELYPIGIKKDDRLKVDEWGYEQEML